MEMLVRCFGLAPQSPLQPQPQPAPSTPSDCATDGASSTPGSSKPPSSRSIAPSGPAHDFTVILQAAISDHKPRVMVEPTQKLSMTTQGGALEHPSHQPPPSPIARPTSLAKVLQAAHAGPSLGRKAGMGFNSVSLLQADGVHLSPACSTDASPSSPARHTTRCAKLSGNSQAVPTAMVHASKSDSYNCVDVAARDGGVSRISYMSGVEVHAPLRSCSLCVDANVVSDSTLLHIEPPCHRGSRRASTSLKGTEMSPSGRLRPDAPINVMEATFASLRTLTLTAGYDHKPASRGGSLKRWQRLIKANHSAANSSELAGLGDGGPLSPTAAAGASCSAMFQRRSVQGPAAAGRPPSCDAVLAAKHVLTQRSLGYLAMHGHAVASTAPTSPVSTRSNAGHSMSLVKGVALHKTLADAALEQGLSVPGLLAMAPVI